MKTKTFDCVEMKHQAQERIRAETEGMTREEELAYWRQSAAEGREALAGPRPEHQGAKRGYSQCD